MRIITLIFCGTVLVNCSRVIGSLPVPAGMPIDNTYATEAGRLLTVHSRTVTGYESLYSFRGATDGANPHAGLTIVNGTLYGTTEHGGNDPSGNCGAEGCGSVFALNLPSGQERVLYSFQGQGNGYSDGSGPAAGLIDVKGTLYGTTQFGGGGVGTVFSFKLSSGYESVLYSFEGGTDGELPLAGLITRNSMLYGTTSEGGCISGYCGSIYGTVFEVSTTYGTESVVHSFGSGSDGRFPIAGLIDVKGTLYGTTLGGGGSGCRHGDGCGTVFEVSTSGTERVLYSFKGGTDGSGPATGLIDVNGMLYGTTASGGAKGNGTVFEVSSSGSEKVLYSFKGRKDGSEPEAGLIDVKGTLYGTTALGGANSEGTVFKITTTGVENVLHSFKGGTDGAWPDAGLVAAKGALYGTTVSGGGYGPSGGNGTIFRISP